MLHLLSAPLSAVFLHAAPAEDVQLVEASASVGSALPTYSIEELLNKPELRLGETQRVMAHLHGEIEDWNPFLTRFHGADYSCITFWADEQPLWIKEEFDTPAAGFFVRRRTDLAKVLATGKRHDRFALDVKVVAIHAGRPWIEIVDIERTEQQVPEGTVLHAIRAVDMIDREGWALAASELERALRPNLPDHVRRELEILLESCEEALGN